MGTKADSTVEYFWQRCCVSEWPSGSLVEALSSPNTFVGRMKLNSINGPSGSSIFLFDFRIHLGLLEAPVVPNSPTQYRGGSTIEIRL